MTAPHDSGLPVAATLAGWLGACLSGQAHPEEMLAALRTDETLHQVVGLAPEPLTLVMALAELRTRGAHWVGLALPVPGDLIGLAGPAAVNAEVLDVGQAVLVRTGVGAVALVPEEAPDAVTWLARDAAAPRPVDPSEAGQALRLDLQRTTQLLVDLDVARWNPDVVDVLMALHDGRPLPLPSSYDARRRAVVERAVTCLEIVALARESESGAVSASEIEQRRAALDPLERSARHALVAACSG